MSHSLSQLQLIKQIHPGSPLRAINTERLLKKKPPGDQLTYIKEKTRFEPLEIESYTMLLTNVQTVPQNVRNATVRRRRLARVLAMLVKE